MVHVPLLSLKGATDDYQVLAALADIIEKERRKECHPNTKLYKLISFEKEGQTVKVSKD